MISARLIVALSALVSIAHAGEVTPFNVDDVCPDGSAELSAESPWRRVFKHPSCPPDSGDRFVSYPPKMCKGDESSVVIYLNGENTENKGCMAAGIEDCHVDMESFQSLEADVRMKDCVGIWAAPLWQKPVFVAQGNVSNVYYNQGLSGEYDYLEICPAQDTREDTSGTPGAHPWTNVGPADGGWRGPWEPAPDGLNFPRQQWDKHWNGTAENNVDDFAQHVTVVKNATTGELLVQYCTVDNGPCQITWCENVASDPNCSARYGTNISLSEIFTGTKNSDDPPHINHPVPRDEKGKVELFSDIWNTPSGYEGCSIEAKKGATCRLSVTNLKVTGGLPNTPTCSKIMSAPQDGEGGHDEL